MPGIARPASTIDWFEFVYDDFERICAIIGVDLKTVPVRALTAAASRQKPCIWFSGFWSQGDGACFEGRYRLREGRASEDPRPCAEGWRASPDRRRLAGDPAPELLSTPRHRDPPRSLLPRILHGDLGRARQPDRPGHDGRCRRDRHRGAARSRHAGSIASSNANTTI